MFADRCAAISRRAACRSLFLSVGKRFDCEEMNLNPAGDRSPRSSSHGHAEPRLATHALSNEPTGPLLLCRSRNHWST